IVSAIRNGKELMEIIGRDEYRSLGYGADATWIQTQTPISPGNSGGPLVNMNAEIVGLNTWHWPDGQNLNFAIGLPDVRRFFDENKRRPIREFFTLPKRRQVRVRIAPGREVEFELPLPTGRVFTLAVFGGDRTLREKDAVVLKYPNGAVFAA